MAVLIDDDRWKIRNAGVERVAAAALVQKEHPFSFRQSGFSALTGELAMKSLDADLRLLKVEKTGSIVKRQRYAKRLYRRCVEEFLSMHPEAVLANRLGQYVPGLAASSFDDELDSPSLDHSVFLPYSPGGFIRVDFSIAPDSWKTDPTVDFNVVTDSFPGDVAGAEADQPYNDPRNSACRSILVDHFNNIADEMAGK